MKKRFRIFIAILLLIAAVLFCIGAFKRAFRPGGNDFIAYLVASSTLWEGRDPYYFGHGKDFPYLYPPFFAFVLIPLIALPKILSVLFWFLLNLAALALSCRLILKLSENLNFIKIGILLLLFAAPLQSNFLNGQVNTLLLLFCLCFFYFWKTSRSVYACLFLALAIILKVMPFVLLGFLLFRKRFREMIYTLFFLAILCLLPAVIVGEAIFDLYDSFQKTILHYTNQPVIFLEGKKFFSVTAFLTYIGLDVSTLVSKLFVLAVIAVLELIRIVKRIEDRPYVWFSLYLIVPLLISPLSEIHHFVLCIPAAALTLSSKKEELPFMIAFWISYFIGHLFEEGPFYFLSLISLFTLLCLRALLRQSENTSIVMAQES